MVEFASMCGSTERTLRAETLGESQQPKGKAGSGRCGSNAPGRLSLVAQHEAEIKKPQRGRTRGGLKNTLSD